MTVHSVARVQRRQSRTPSRPKSQRHRWWALAAFACSTSPAGFPCGITAQETDAPPNALRSLRHLAVGNVSLLNSSRPTLVGGYLFQEVSLRERMESGVTELKADIGTLETWVQGINRRRRKQTDLGTRW